jgi:hypothetical protein
MTAYAAAHAQVDPRADGIGIYFDWDAQTNCLVTTSSMQPVTGYLSATRLSDQACVVEWECAVITEGGGFISPAWSIMGAGTNFLTAPQFAVGIGIEYLPWAPAVVLAVLHGYVESPASQVLFYIDALPAPSFPEYLHNAVCIAGQNPLVPIPLWQSTGGYDIPVAAINGDCPVPEVRSSWGAVKTLYD